MRKYAFCLICSFLLTLLTQAGNVQATEPSLAEIQKLAEQGDVEAQTNLGRMYFYGRGIPQDHAKAIYWTQKAAEQGYIEAQLNLGLIYSKNRNMKIAEQWFQKAADQGVPEAQAFLGFILATRNDYVKAVQYLQKAVEQEIPAAQLYLGLMYMDGRGVGRDIKKGCDLLQASFDAKQESVVPIPIELNNAAIEVYKAVCVK